MQADVGACAKEDKQVHVQAWLGIVPYFCFWNGSPKPSGSWDHSGANLNFCLCFIHTYQLKEKLGDTEGSE